MKTIHIFILFIVVAIAQIFVPINMIFGKEDILAKGQLYKFKTRPIDPADPFRGRYIALDFEVGLYVTKDSTWQRGEDLCIYLETDSLGYAKVSKISRVLLPNEKKNFVNAKARWYNKQSKELNIQYPFNRYYMGETKAYDAEVAVRNAHQDSLIDTYALVYVKAGEAVLDDVIVNNISIKDYVKKMGVK
ncbi:GDYXXLXY domain-containing protein [Aestuariivivens marinum]|uniref:GDYXXLXY domain-containing protein n=1 Tax=Aestuariivivens marinum TaxID=2913555 RepID=UPI001F5AB4C9|nr:GDYXXLXY domain-containing protein [Aestuariivivens marinum]